MCVNYEPFDVDIKIASGVVDNFQSYRAFSLLRFKATHFFVKFDKSRNRFSF